MKRDEKTVRIDFVYDDGFGGEYPIKADVRVWHDGVRLCAEVAELIEGPIGNDGQELTRLHSSVIQRCEEMAMDPWEAKQ